MNYFNHLFLMKFDQNLDVSAILIIYVLSIFSNFFLHTYKLFSFFSNCSNPLKIFSTQYVFVNAIIERKNA